MRLEEAMEILSGQFDEVFHLVAGLQSDVSELRDVCVGQRRCVGNIRHRSHVDVRLPSV